LVTSSRYELAKYLPLLASLASKIYLQPGCLNKETAQKFYEKSEIDYVINISDTDIDINEIYVSQQDINLDQEWLLSTSGTSGTPKLVSYGLDKLMSASKKNVLRGNEFSWGLCYDLNRFAGLQVYFQAVSSGSALSIAEASSDSGDIVKLFTNKQVNCLSGTPSFWRKILMTQGSNKLDLKRITLGGEIADQAILSSLGNVFTNSKISHIYASTEAGVGFSVQDGLMGFPEEYLELTSQLGVELKVRDNILWIKSDGSASDILSGNLIIDENGL
jgi:Acyl-CoA synthetases (AMP-forming)/AMP-acid ligases II